MVRCSAHSQKVLGLIEFVILGSFGIKLTDWLLFWYPGLIYYVVGVTKSILGMTALSKYKSQCRARNRSLVHMEYFLN